MPEKIKEAMQMQVEAERRKRAAILESEGLREAEINKAEAKKRKCVLESEGIKIENINRAEGGLRCGCSCAVIMDLFV